LNGATPVSHELSNDHISEGSPYKRRERKSLSVYIIPSLFASLPHSCRFFPVPLEFVYDNIIVPLLGHPMHIQTFYDYFAAIMSLPRKSCCIQVAEKIS
jgi:hypothetical protein